MKQYIVESAIVKNAIKKFNLTPREISLYEDLDPTGIQHKYFARIAEWHKTQKIEMDNITDFIKVLEQNKNNPKLLVKDISNKMYSDFKTAEQKILEQLNKFKSPADFVGIGLKKFPSEAKLLFETKDYYFIDLFKPEAAIFFGQPQREYAKKSSDKKVSAFCIGIPDVDRNWFYEYVQDQDEHLILCQNKKDLYTMYFINISSDESVLFFDRNNYVDGVDNLEEVPEQVYAFLAAKFPMEFYYLLVHYLPVIIIENIVKTAKTNGVDIPNMKVGSQPLLTKLVITNTNSWALSIMLKNGGDVNTKYEGKTLLDWVIYQGYDNLIDILINNGAKLTKYGKEHASVRQRNIILKARK
jgi:hypothetical protein